MPRWYREHRNANASRHGDVARNYSGDCPADGFRSYEREPYWCQPIRVRGSSEGSLPG